jgi:hypothetical protein
MGYQGNYPPSTPLTSSQIGAGAVDSNALAADAVQTVDIANGAVTIPKLSATGTASSATFLRGDGAWAAAGLSWQAVQTSGFTAVSGRAYPCNTTSAAFTVTLPASPASGDQIVIVDYAGIASTNPIYVAPNGNKIQGVIGTLTLSSNRQSVVLVYVDSTQGWISYAQQYLAYGVGVPASYLIIAGGGGGGNWAGGRGGGAGGLLSGITTMTTGTTYSFSIGAGGSGGVSTSGSDDSTNGSNTTAFSLTAIGGGAGKYANVGSAGGSGGAGLTSAGVGTFGQGNNSGINVIANMGGGGGGAGAAGANSSSTQGGAGGAGSASSITGSSVTYAGGGGGGAHNSGGTGGAGGAGGGAAGANYGTTNAAAGTANTGGGGGGAGGRSGINGQLGGNGGSGVVIISVPTSLYTGTTTGSPTITTSGSNTILKFTASGSYTA